MRRLKKLLDLLILTEGQKAYLRRIRVSGLFDRAFYLASNPGIHWLFHLFPERHFILMGEGAGLQPCAGFSPRAYLRHNPDVARSPYRPFEHYVAAGRGEDRLTLEQAAEAPPQDLRMPVLRGPGIGRARAAAVAHVYYPGLWPEIRDALAGSGVEFDLYVTLTRGAQGQEALRARIEADWPGARVTVMPNRGRDILPFLHILNSGWLQGYDAVCKLHTKKSPHRDDGAAWRRHLIRGILPGGETPGLLARFLSDPDAGIWAAEGQVYDGPDWWGSNLAAARALLARVEVSACPDRLTFPAGSIYWIKPAVLDMLRGLRAGAEDFEPELGQTDGTAAHAVERAIGRICAAGGLALRQTSELAAAAAALPRPGYVSAFYLPQFHPIPENDAWWGRGFTEWTQTSRARPQFAGHAQPVLPADLGFYDLRLPEAMGRQAALAAEHGVDAFCVYHYWFGGKRLLETPLDNLLARPEIDFPFYLCWANESWRRNWDGLSGEVLAGQAYAPGFAGELARSLLPYFRDPRYQRPDGTRPRFVIYRPGDMPDPAAAVAAMRRTWRAAGIGEVELGAVLFHLEDAHPAAPDLFDFWIEMPPHGLVTEDEDYLFGGSRGDCMPAAAAPGFAGLVYSYDGVRRRSLEAGYAGGLPGNTIAGIMPSWDNTARRGAQSHVAWGGSPAAFGRWLRDLRRVRLEGSYRGEIMINAWNEWAEKAKLEPCSHYGDGYLRALKRGLG
jgi:lipopolysaccharide biosynthesis protein